MLTRKPCKSGMNIKQYSKDYGDSVMRKSTKFLLKTILIWWAFIVFLVAFMVLIGGCTSVHVGLGVHPTGLDGPEIGLENPIGMVGGEYEFINNRDLTVSGFFDHYSGLFQQEQGGGFNVLGVKAKIDLTNR